MGKYITRTEFAQIAGVSAQAISKACKNRRLHNCIRHKRINIDHPEAVAYLNRHTVDNTIGIVEPLQAASKPLTKKPRKKTASKPLQDTRHQATKKTKKELSLETLIDGDNEVDIETIGTMTLNEIITRFGSDVAFLDWLKATKEIETVIEKRLKNAQTKGTLISRRLVERGVIDIINSAHLRMLKDGAKSITAGVVSKTASGAELKEIENYVSDVLGSFIKPVKNKMVRCLQDV